MIGFTFDLIRRYRSLNYALIDQAMISAVNFLTGVLLARALGLAEFGVFALAWVVIGIFSGLQGSFVGAPMMSVGAKQSAADAPSYFAAVFLHQAAFAASSVVVVLVGVSVASVYLPDWGLARFVFPLAAATVAYQTQDFMRRYFFVRRRPAAALGNDCISYLGQLAVLLWLFQEDMLSPAIALWAVAATSAMAILIGAFQIGRLPWRRAKFVAVWKRHWVFARWMGGASVLWLCSNALFQALAGMLLGPAAVGALRAAQNLMGIAQAFYLAMENIVPHRAAHHYHAGGLSELISYMLRVATFGGSATAAICLFFALAPEFWLRLIFGEEFVAYGFLVRLYAVYFFINFFSVPLTSSLRALEETWAIFLATCAGAGLTIALAYPLISTLGVSGVLIGMLASQVAGKMVLLTGWLRHLKHARREI